jgi:hypothetical protein
MFVTQFRRRKKPLETDRAEPKLFWSDWGLCSYA